MRVTRVLLLSVGCAALSAASAGPSRSSPNVLYLVHDDTWIPALQSLVEARETLDYDFEGGRAWDIEVRSMDWVRANFTGPDTAAVKAYVSQRRAQCDGDLFVMLVGDANDPYTTGQSELDHIPMRYIYDPEIAGSELGWGDHVPTDDLYADPTGSGALDVCVFRLPAHDVADVQAYVAKAVAVLQNQFASIPQERPSARNDYFLYVDVVAEDADREGRSGALVREHAQAIQAMWPWPWATTYLGDSWPYDYESRQAAADALDNRGHQIKISLGTIANRSNHVNFQDQRPPRNWDPATNLIASEAFWLHLGLCCGLGDCDRDEVYGRPHAERTLLAPDRGSFAIVAPTRTARQFPLYWFGAEMTRRIVAGAPPASPGRCVGRIWRDTKNALLATYPAHHVEWRAFIGLGDPTVRVVPPAPVPTQVDGAATRGEPRLFAAPNPARGATGVRYFLPAPSPVALEVFDVAGRRVRRLVPGVEREAGLHAVLWDGRDDSGRTVASGVYYTRLVTGRATRSVTIVRLR